MGLVMFKNEPERQYSKEPVALRELTAYGKKMDQESDIPPMSKGQTRSAKYNTVNADEVDEGDLDIYD